MRVTAPSQLQLCDAAAGPASASVLLLPSACSKRMEATPKLTLIQQLGVVPVCARWQAGLPNVEEEPELAVKYAR